MTHHVYHGLAMDAYLKMPAVSASILRDVNDRCPAAAWFGSWLNPQPELVVEEYDDKAIVGIVAHRMLLEGNADGVVVIDPLEHRGVKGGIPKGWTNEKMREARDAALEAGRLPILPAKMAIAEAMVSTARAFIESLKETEPSVWRAFQPGGGESEVTITWNDDGVPCRIRPDRISDDHRVLIDYKTGGTTAEPDTWGRVQMVRMGYYTSAAFYRRGVEAAFGTRPDYLFLVQEQDPPYLCSLVGIDPAGCELGDSKIRRALSTWADCVRTNTWPAYPNRVCYAELPPWELAKWEEGETQRGAFADPAKLYRGIFTARESDPA